MNKVEITAAEAERDTHNNDTLEYKVCKKCLQLLPATEEFFHFYHRSYDGKRTMRTECKSCISKERQKYYISNKDRINARNKQYVQKAREENSPVYQRMKESSRKYGKKRRETDPEWYERQKQTVRDWYAAHQDERAEYRKEYYSDPEHRFDATRRAHKRKQGLGDQPDLLTYEEWQEILDKFQHQCAYCGATENLEQDHVLPVAQGGRYAKENIVPACKFCNRSKRSHDFIEWYRSMPFYDSDRESLVLKHGTDYAARLGGDNEHHG